jgi:hypothetical protein
MRALRNQDGEIPLKAWRLCGARPYIRARTPLREAPDIPKASAIVSAGQGKELVVNSTKMPEPLRRAVLVKRGIDDQCVAISIAAVGTTLFLGALIRNTE